MAYVISSFGTATDGQAIITKRWHCSGDEQDLLSCPQENRPSCGHRFDAGVYCYGEISELGQT